MLRMKYAILSVLKYLSLLLGTLVAIVPILVVFFASFKDAEEYSSTGLLQPPSNWLNFANYTRAFTEGNMLLGFFNTLLIVGIATTGAIILGTMIAYVLSRFEFRGKKFMIGAFMFAVLIPGITMQVSTFQIINSLGLFNTRGAAIILYLGTDIIAVYIFLQFLNRISTSLDESAMLEGASYFTIYSKIIVPLLKPAIATVIVLKGVGIYNDFYTPFLYMPKSELAVLSTALFKFQGPYGNQWEVICAGIMIIVIPTIIVFLTLQKYIYNGYSDGAVK
ncbi:carbohydrate ABC transporter permease [Caldalkalibacillus mannanilyticus]|uniref:carbohydrate ABC transporter permease n=1 Tax=Caldalkalibacillus mannanilyticus TaxID=1418 RepID=UPI00046955D8